MDPTYQGFGAPVPTKNTYRRGVSGKMLGLIGLGIILVIAGAVLLYLGRDQTGPLQQRLTARLATLQKIAAEGTKNAKDPDLRELNSIIVIQVMSDTTTIQSNMNTKGIDKAITAAEADAATFTELNNAALNSRFDTTYRKVIAAKLDSTNALIKELYDKSTDKSLRTSLSKTYEHFKQLQTQLANASS